MRGVGAGNRAVVGLVAWLLLGVLAPATRALTVRVDAAGGVPRLVIDGAPVRARMFWGAPGSPPIAVGPGWTAIDFEFQAAADAPNGTLHFRFGAKPGTVVVDDLRVVDLDTGRDLVPLTTFDDPAAFRRDWTSWPTDATNTVGTVRLDPKAGRDGSAGLVVTLKEPPGGQWPDFHVFLQPRLNMERGHRYRVTLRVQAEPARELTLAFYRPGATYTHLGGPPNAFARQIGLAAKAGVDLVSFPIDLPWPPEGTPPDWSSVDAACEAVLRANPKALLLPRMGMDPPPWWKAAHPGDVMQWDDGRRDAMVVASPAYRRDAAARLAALVAHLEATFGNHVAGYHPCGQNTGEWFYHDTWKAPLNGYAPADRDAWRAWLAARYPNDAALRRAWGDSTATRAAAEVPTPAARRASKLGVFHDPRSERPQIDWAEFQQQAMADCVAALARVVREQTKGRKLVVFFYGYVFEFGAIPNGAAVSGHYALRRLLDNPDIDVLCSPISYFDRGPGQSAPIMTAAESVALAGKMWLNEDDTHTVLATGDFPGRMDHARSVEETVDELMRNVGQEATRNVATWWMDLGATGWFDHPTFWDAMKRLEPIDRFFLDHPTPFRPEVAAILDEPSLLPIAAGGDRATLPGVYEARRALGRMGAPYGQYLLDDLIAGRVPAKLRVVLNAWSLDASRRAALIRATRGGATVWCYAPGYLDPAGPSPSAMAELTGFRLRPVRPSTPRATPTARGRALGLTHPIGPDRPVAPLFAAVDATEAETLARYDDGSPAVALRTTPRGPSLFVGPPGLTSELLRAAAKVAGVHLYASEDCNVYANGPYVVVHGDHDGPITLDVGKTGPVRDALDGTAMGQGPRLVLPLRRGQTRLLAR